MKKGKRELIIEIANTQRSYKNFKEILDKKVKDLGAAYYQDVKMYFNVEQMVIYCVCGETTFTINVKEMLESE